MTNRKGYLFYDDETANSRQRICQVGYLLTDFDGNPIDGPVNQLIDPEDEFGWYETKVVHHITAADVEGAPNFARFCEESGFLGLLSDYVLVAHNALGADCHHIEKSLAAYGIAMPEIECIDTKKLAVEHGLDAGLEALCRGFGIEVGNHHDALSDARACAAAFWRMREAFGDADAGTYEAGRRSAKRGGVRMRFEGLGRVNGSDRRIEDVLEEAGREGRRGDLGTIDDLAGLRVTVTGIVPGYTREQVRALLKGLGVKVGSSVGKKTRYLAVGDNAGQSKIDAAAKLGIELVSVGELMEALDRVIGD